MNSCVLMARIVRAPELRYTSDNQTQLAEMTVEFPGLRAEDPPVTMKVVGWGNLAGEIAENYSEGQQVLLEGRLRMNVVDLDGRKEKRAELIASRVHRVEGDLSSGSAAIASAPRSAPAPVAAQPSRAPEPAPAPEPQPDWDDIPF